MYKGLGVTHIMYKYIVHFGRKCPYPAHSLVNYGILRDKKTFSVSVSDEWTDQNVTN